MTTFEQGGKAYRDGVSFDACPFIGEWPLDTQRASWRAGWIDASLHPDRGIRVCATPAS